MLSQISRGAEMWREKKMYICGQTLGGWSRTGWGQEKGHIVLHIFIFSSSVGLIVMDALAQFMKLVINGQSSLLVSEPCPVAGMAAARCSGSGSRCLCSLELLCSPSGTNPPAPAGLGICQTPHCSQGARILPGNQRTSECLWSIMQMLPLQPRWAARMGNCNWARLCQNKRSGWVGLVLSTGIDWE